MARTINLAPGLTLPATDLATSVSAILGIRGSGKSNLAAVIAEGLLDANIPIVVLDRVGIWFSLRLDQNGKTPSRFAIPVLGGAHGDIALQPGAGAQVAEALAASHSSAVLDISRFSKADRIRFATDFGEAFFEAKKRAPGPVSLLLEEAQRYIPQVIRFSGTGLERCLGAYEEIAEQGRNYGVGLILISLRPEKLNKDVVNLAENVFALRALGVHERKAVAEWVQEKDAEGRDDVKNELPSLPEGHGIVWSPALFKVYGKFHFRLKSTYDAGKTPDRVRAAVKMKALDLDELEAAMGKVVEEAKANDPKALRARIVELERQVQTSRVDATKISAAHGSMDAKLLERLIDKLQKGEERFKEIGLAALDVQRDRLAQAQQALLTELGNVRTLIGRAPQTERPRERFVDPGRGPRQATVKPNGTATATLSKAARSILAVLAQRNAASDSQISALSGYRRTSSTFANALSELRTQGLIVGTPDRREIAGMGRSVVGPIEPLPTGVALLQYWVSRLTKCEAVMLSTIYDRGTISRAELADLTGYSITSSTFANGLSGLRTLDLVHGPNGGDVTIAEVFNG